MFIVFPRDERSCFVLFALTALWRELGGLGVWHRAVRLSVFIAGLLCLGTLNAAELPPAEAGALLEKLQQHRAKFPALTADFTEEKTTHLLTKPLLGTGTIAFQKPNKFRRELKGSDPSVTVSDGEKLWIYYPNFKEAELYTLGKRQAFDDLLASLTAGLNFDRVGDFYRFRVFREASGYRIALTPKSGTLKRMIKELAVWVDDDFKIEKTEATLPKEDRLVTTYRNQKATSIPASTFDFTPPPDAHVSQPLGK